MIIIALLKPICQENQEKFVRDQINRARVLDREELLAPRPMATNNRIPFVVTYHPGLPNIGGILR